ncbi:acylphosphatase [Chloroflexota bacterium]
MTDLVSVKAIIYGRVQDVFFRAFTSRHAVELGLTGYVRNLGDKETVEVHVEGERNKLEKFLDHLKIGPPGARVERVETNWSEYSGSYSDFGIRY